MSKSNREERINEILSYSKEMNLEEVAQTFGYKNEKVLKSMMNRYGYSWSSLETTFVKKKIKEESKTYTPPAATLNGKIINSLSNNNGDLKDTLNITNFKSVPELAEYMKEHNYNWSSSIKNYVQVASINYDSNPKEDSKTCKDAISTPKLVQVNLEKMVPDIQDEKMLKFIINNKEQIKELLEEDYGPQNMPRYCVPGIHINKSIYMINTVADLIGKFAVEKHITIKEVALIAFIEFFKKYGYKDVIKNIFE